MKNKFKIKSRSSYLILFISIILISSSGCKKFVEVPPPAGTITENSVFTSDAPAIAVLTDLYNQMNNSTIQGNGCISLFAGLAGDEYTLNGGITSAVHIGYYNNILSQLSVPAVGAEHWRPLYNFVFKCNAAIEGLNKSESLTPSIKQQLLGEAKFLRAFFYFYLVNEFGDVPLAITTDPKVNTLLSRSPKASVYQQIIADLQDAEEKLSANYLGITLLNTTMERVRPTKWAAAALLARVYLYTGDNYAKAEEEASKVIGNTSLFDPPSLVSLNNVFLKNSRESIWQIQPTTASFNTIEARTLILPASGPSTGGVTTNPVYLSSQLLSSFESGDQRTVNTNWINSVTVGSNTYRFPFKYKIYLPNTNITGSNGMQHMTEYFMVLRVAEQYLIRAEARAKQNNLHGAIADLDQIRARAGLTLIANTNPGISQTALLEKILDERRHELFSEWGHRWFDLKRTGKIDEVMTIHTPIKSNNTSQWQSYQALFPLPLETINAAPNVVQNSGY